MLSPLEGSGWFRFRCKLVEEKGIIYLAASEDAVPELYSPLQLPPLGEPFGRPEEWKSWPHTFLARVNPQDPASVLEFVDVWGLLGWWGVQNYRWWPWPWRGRREPYRVRGAKLEHPTWFSRHYINPTYEGERGRRHLLAFREPLPAVSMAIEEYQRFAAMAAGEPAPHAPKTPRDRKSAALDILNKYLADCRAMTWYEAAPEEKWRPFWQAPSLLHFCYLLAWFDMTGLRQWRRCAHKPCSGLFLTARRDKIYCSERCKENAKRLRNYYRSKGR